MPERANLNPSKLGITALHFSKVIADTMLVRDKPLRPEYVEFGEELTENNEYLTDITSDSDAGIVRATIEFNEEITGDTTTIDGWCCNFLPDGSVGISGRYSNIADIL